MDKEVLWTDLVGNMEVGQKGVYWELKDTHLRHWSLHVQRRDNESPLKLTFAYMIDKNWIPNPGNAITLASVGDRDHLNVTVLEGLEERVLSIDCKRHRFHLEPFTKSIEMLPPAEREEMERMMVSGVSKKAINFLLEAIGDINQREANEREALRKQKKKQAETLMKSRTDDEESKKKKHTKQKPGDQDVEGTREGAKKPKRLMLNSCLWRVWRRNQTRRQLCRAIPKRQQVRGNLRHQRGLQMRSGRQNQKKRRRLMHRKKLH
jgi:hypothetical protein